MLLFLNEERDYRRVRASSCKWNHSTYSGFALSVDKRKCDCQECKCAIRATASGVSEDRSNAASLGDAHEVRRYNYIAKRNYVKREFGSPLLDLRAVNGASTKRDSDECTRVRRKRMLMSRGKSSRKRDASLKQNRWKREAGLPGKKMQARGTCQDNRGEMRQ